MYMNLLYKKPLVINSYGCFQPLSVPTSWVMNIFKGILSVWALVFVQDSFGQSAATFNKISVTSPTASALQKFTDYPVNLNNGLVDISIPIYNINVNGINVPIEFKYHAAGIKYDDECKSLGLGWALIAGGMITDIVQGNVDNPASNLNFFKVSGNINPSTAYDGGDNTSLMTFDRGYGDSEYDIYNFTFPGHSGKFFYPGTSTPVISPLKNLVINRNGGGSNIGGDVFDITDESGTTYKFGYYSNGSSNPDSFIREQDRIDHRTCNFLLTEIISANKADTVRFAYSGRVEQTKFVIQDKVIVRDGFTFPSTATYDPVHENLQSSYLMPFDYAKLIGITFRTGHVEFNYNSGPGLSGIKVYSNLSTTPVKVITVQQSSFGPDYYKLDQVDFQDNQQQQSYNYKLSYNGTPYNRRFTGIDYWGYHNGQSYSGDYVPNFQVATMNNQSQTSQPVTVGSMDRNPNELAMQQGMLQKVTYPTGGSSVFNFEAHRYSGGQVAGGLRIKKIDNYDLNGTYLNSKWYKYGQSESGDGNIYKPIDPVDYTYEVCGARLSGGPWSYYYYNGPYVDWVCRERTYGVFPIINNTWGGGSAVVYDQVTEYTGDGVNANGKTVYNYENPIDFFSHRGLPLVAYSNSWKAGQLLSKQIFSKTGADYNQVYAINNQYDDFNVAQYHNLKIVSTFNLKANMSQEDLFLFLENYDNTTLLRFQHDYNDRGLQIHNYADYYLLTGSRELTSSTEVRDGVSTTTSYTYDPTYLKPVEITTTKSTGDNLLTRFTYPFSLTAAPYPAMVANNIIEPVITKSEFKNDTAHPLESVTTDYGNWGSLYAPQSVSTQKGSDAAETRLIYDAYDDRGNILQRHRAAGPFEAYLWGYNKQYPIAEVKNATYQDVINVIGQSVIDQLNSNPQTDDQVRNALAPIRSALPNAQVTTYTYSSLVGMTSMTDAKGMTTYYEYDGFQRLVNMRDKDGNIVKHNDYHYQNQ